MADTRQDIQVVLAAQEMFVDIEAAAQATASKAAGVFTAVLAGGKAAISAVADFTATAAAAASVQEDAETRLALALGRSSQGLVNQASALQGLTAYSDQAVMGVQAMMASFTGSESSIKAATKATLDLAAGAGMDLPAAAKLVSEAVSGESNALAQYGIKATGAAGSAERLASVTAGLNNAFGGSAQAQANTFSGRLEQLKNSFGGVLESIGSVITRNPVFIKALEIATQLFDSLAKKIGDNKQFLMELAAKGLVMVVKGIGWAIEVVRLFHNHWNLVKIVGNAAVVALADGLKIFFQSMRHNVLAPLDELFKVLVNLGAMKSNPFDAIEEKLKLFQGSSREVLKSVVDDTAAVNQTYDNMKNAVNTYAETLENIQVKETETAGVIRAQKTETAAHVVEKTQEQIDAEKAKDIESAASARLTGWIEQGKANVVNAAYGSMQKQMMKWIETGKFSTKELMKVVADQVKIELVGLAAKSAVWAIFELAMGLATMFTHPAASGAHFAAAGKFALVSGAALMAAKGVNSMFGGSKEEGAPAAGAGEAAPAGSTVGDGGLAGPAPAAGGPVYNVTLTVMNPLSDQNWDAAVEQQLIPALERAGARNVQLSTNVVRSS